LSARGAVRVYLSNDAEFINVTAFDFNPDPVLSTSTLSVTGIPWTLAGNSGQQTVYALLASSTNNRLPPIATTVDLGICQSADDELTETPVTPEEESALPAGYAISPFDGTTIEEVEKIGDGQTFKGEHYDTIYLLEDGKRRPFLNESTYFTWWTNFDQIRTVSDSTLLAYPIGSAMLPKPGSILLQIESDSKVYISEEPNILHQIADDDTAQMLLGSAWQAFVFHLPSTIFSHYLIGEPVQSFAPWDTRHFFTWFGLRINDLDRDGLSDTEEAELGTDPSLNDTDGDGGIDSVEVEDGTDPLNRN
jgi:hypothetical protein